MKSQKPSAPLRVRLRPDLVAVPVETNRGRQWHVKDPVSLRFFQFDQREFGLLQMLDGASTVDAIIARFRAEFAPLHLSARQLLFFVDEARRSGLLLLDRPHAPHAEEEARKAKGPPLMRWLGRLNVLAIRLPGFDPDSFLDAAYPFVRVWFTRTAVVLATLFLLAAILLVTLRFDQFVERLPERAEVFTPQTLLWLAAALAVTKVLHELAHAFACKHFGGECHEIGVLLLMFVPCLYCNVSDSWLLARRRERMLITAAGMWMELQLAAAATFVWWFAVDGPVRMAALSVMFVCSVSTLLLNGNPLMRYDGYYLLSDLAYVPNLSSESSRVLRGLWRRWAFGLVDPQPPRADEPHTFLAIYGVASFLYRMVLLTTILLVVHALGREFRMQVLAWIITLLTLTNLVLPLLITAANPLARRAERRRIDPLHAFATLVLLGGIAAALAFIPVRHSLRAPFVLEADGAERIVVTVPGRLVEALPAGATVSPGDLVGRLENLELSRERETLAARRDLLQRQLDILTATRNGDAEAASRIPATREAIADLDQQLTTLTANLSRLELRTTRSGSVLSPPNVPRKPTEREQLPVWSGSPLDPANRGCYLEAGTPYCLVGDDSHLAATVIVPQEDVPFVQLQQRVELLLTGLGDRTVTGTVAEVSPVPVDALPREIAAAHLVPVDTRGSTPDRPLEPVYRVKVTLDTGRDATPLVRWTTGDARIRLSSEPLGRRLWRAVQRTFHFEL